VSRHRILIVHSSDEMYGADRIVLQVVAAMRQLAGAGAESPVAESSFVEVWLPDDIVHGPTPLCHELERQGIPFRHFALPIIRRANLRPKGIVRLLRQAFSLRRALRRERFDMVYCMTSACLLAAPVARSAGVKSVALHVQEMWAGPEARLLRLLARFTTLRITISAAVDRAAHLQRPPSTIVDNCVPHPTAIEPTEPTVPPVPADRRPRFVVASRWNAWKGHRTLIDAWNRAGCPGHLAVLGGPPPSGDRVDVAALAASVSDPSTIEIVGEVPDIAAYLTHADALVLPSDEPEPFGLVIIEAFGLGRAAIASRAGGPVDIIDDGVNGWLFTPGDADELAQLLGRLTVDELARAGEHARATYLERYTPEVYRARIGTLISAELTRHDER
jgi:glycosyltransferase involved in cell wall biosynthesis